MTRLLDVEKGVFHFNKTKKMRDPALSRTLFIVILCDNLAL